LGLHAMYPEYIPERLEHCTEPSGQGRSGGRDRESDKYRLEKVRKGREKRVAAFVEEARKSIVEMPRALTSKTSVAARSGMSSISLISTSLQRGRDEVGR